MADDLDLDAIRARYQTAREAGRAADPTEGSGELTRAVFNAVVRSWQDVAPLHDEVRRLRSQLAESQRENQRLRRLAKRRDGSPIYPEAWSS